MKTLIQPTSRIVQNSISEKNTHQRKSNYYNNNNNNTIEQQRIWQNGKMNSTSPGRAERVQTSGNLATITFGPQSASGTSSFGGGFADYRRRCNSDAAKAKDVVMPPSFENSIMPKVMHGSSKIDLERLYDDPCELMDEWNTPVRIPRSRSWLCCPQASKTIVQDQPVFDRSTLSSYEHSHLITEPPRIGQNNPPSIVSLIACFLFLSSYLFPSFHQHVT